MREEIKRAALTWADNEPLFVSQDAIERLADRVYRVVVDSIYEKQKSIMDKPSPVTSVTGA